MTAELGAGGKVLTKGNLEEFLGYVEEATSAWKSGYSPEETEAYDNVISMLDGRLESEDLTIRTKVEDFLEERPDEDIDVESFYRQLAETSRESLDDAEVQELDGTADRYLEDLRDRFG